MASKKQTESSLVPAKIIPFGNGAKAREKFAVSCMFNPFEYTVSKSNTYKEKPKASAETPILELQQSGSQTLKLSLIFDTYEEKTDVTLITRKLWKLMEPIEAGKDEKGKKKRKKQAPFVAFQWGCFSFESVITNMTQKFTLFLHDGTPVRAKIDVTFTQHSDKPDYQNPTSGGGPAQEAVQVLAGDRLDSIATQVYGEPTKWRHIAEYNNISNPFTLKPGQTILIPEVE